MRERSQEWLLFLRVFSAAVFIFFPAAAGAGIVAADLFSASSVRSIGIIYIGFAFCLFLDGIVKVRQMFLQGSKILEV